MRDDHLVQAFRGWSTEVVVNGRHISRHPLSGKFWRYRQTTLLRGQTS